MDGDDKAIVADESKNQESSEPDESEDQKRKALIETLEATKQNHELQVYITSTLDQMMINYNAGFIMKLGIDEKQRLKETID